MIFKKSSNNEKSPNEYKAEKSEKNRYYDILAFAVILLAFILRIYYLDYKSLWLDEATNVAMAEKSILTWTFAEPPLYYLILHFALAIGKSEIIIRFPSVIFGTLSIIPIYKIGTMLYSKKEGLVSAFLLAISPTSIIFSQDAKYYSLFLFLSLVTIYFFLKMDEKPTIGNKAIFLVSLILSFYTHYFIILLLITVFIYKIAKSHNNKKQLYSFILLICIFLISISPIIHQFTSQFISRSGGSNSNFIYQTHLTNQFVREIFTYLITNEVVDDSNIYYMYLGLLLIGVLFSIDFKDIIKNSDSSFTSEEKSIIFLAMWLFIPIIMAAALTNIISNLFIRYISFTLPALLLISSHGIVAISNLVNSRIGIKTRKRIDLTKFNFVIILSILIIISMLSFPILYEIYQSKEYDWKGASKFIEENAERNSNIIMVPSYNSIPFQFYYKNNDTNIIGYSSTYDLNKLLEQNNTYLVLTNDINALDPNDVSKIKTFINDKMQIDDKLSGINIYKNYSIN
jgi:uncharacterized membrane protein